MTSPEMWFTLYAIAGKGAVHRRVTMTTRELGAMLGVSQQTASRRLAECVRAGLVLKSHSVNGTILQLTEEGIRELERVLQGLEAVFAPPRDEIVIVGKVTEGLGEGAYYVDIYAQKFQEALGFRPFPGTLNVRVIDEESRRAVNMMKKSPPLIVPGFVHEGRTFGDVICYRVKVGEDINAAIVIAQRTHHSSDILELVAPVNLRRKLGLRNDDTITLRVVPLHRA